MRLSLSLRFLYFFPFVLTCDECPEGIAQDFHFVLFVRNGIDMSDDKYLTLLEDHLPHALEFNPVRGRVSCDERFDFVASVGEGLTRGGCLSMHARPKDDGGSAGVG